MRWLILAGFLCALPLTSQAQNLASTVTYTTNGAPAGRILKELSAKTGVTFATSPQTESEVLAVRLTSVPLPDAMAKIAWAVGGSWKKEGESYRLVRSAEEARAEQARERKYLLAGFGKTLAKRQESMAKAGEFNADRAETLAKDAAAAVRRFNPDKPDDSFFAFSEQLGLEAPAGRAMTRIMGLVTPADLVDLPLTAKVVYSSNPTRTQQPMNAKLASIVSAFQREQALWVESLTKHAVKSPQSGGRTFLLQGVYNADQPIERIGKLLLIVNRTQFGQGAVQVELLVADTAGKVVAQANADIGSDFESDGKPSEPSKDDVKINRPPDLEAIATAFDTGGGADAIPAEIRRRILMPEENEPLGILVGAKRVALAEARKTNLVSALSETSVSFSFGPKETPASRLLAELKLSDEVQETDGWIVTRPFAAASARQVRVDRRLMGQYLRRQVQTSYMKIDEQAEWALRLPVGERAPLVPLLLRLASPAERQYIDPRLLRLFGSLSKPQRAAAKQETGLPMRTLTPAQQQMIQEMVYGELAYLQVDHPKAHELKIDVSLFSGGILREPTESLPNGIPADARLILVEETEEVVFTADPRPGSGSLPSRAISISELAWEKFLRDYPNVFPQTNQPEEQVDLNKLRLGKRTNYLVKLQFTPILSLQSPLEDRDYMAGQAVAYDRLPAYFQREVDELIAQHARAYANRKPALPTNPPIKTPPPTYPF